MNKRAAGVTFIFIAAFLFVGRYMTAAIYMSGVSSWDTEIFKTGLTCVGSPLFILSIISLMIGCIYLFFAETDHWGEKEEKQNTAVDETPDITEE